MVVQDKIRSSLYTQLEQSFGTEEAGLLMEAVPPLGWSSLVTHDHLDARVAQIDARFDAFEARVDARFDAFGARVEARFEVVDARLGVIEDTMRTMVTQDQFTAGMAQFGERFQTDMVHLQWWLIGILITLSGLVIGMLLRAT